jgi:hypothetical protein
LSRRSRSSKPSYGGLAPAPTRRYGRRCGWRLTRSPPLTRSPGSPTLDTPCLLKHIESCSSTSRSTDLGLLFVVLIWGLSPSILKIAFTELEPLAFVFVRFLLLSALSLVVLFVRGR